MILITGEFFPKTIFRINPNISLRVFALPIYLFYLLLWPVSAFTSWLSRALMKLCGFKSDSPRMGMLSVGDLNSYLDRTIDEVNPQRSGRKRSEDIPQRSRLLDNPYTRLYAAAQRDRRC